MGRYTSISSIRINEKQDGEVLNRYCGFITDAKETYEKYKRVALQLAGDSTDMHELCGNITVDG